MKKWMLVGAFALTGTIAHADTGRWTTRETKSELYGSVEYSASLPSEKPVLNALNQPQLAALTLVCGRDGFSIAVVWPDIIEKDYSNSNATMVEWSIDGSKVKKNLWVANVQTTGLYGRAAKSLVRKLAAGKRFLIYIPDYHGGQEAAFQLAGLADIQSAVLAMPCSQ